MIIASYDHLRKRLKQIPKLVATHNKHIESLRFMIENITKNNIKNRDIRIEYLEKEICLEESLIEILLREKREIVSLLEKFLT